MKIRKKLIAASAAASMLKVGAAVPAMAEEEKKTLVFGDTTFNAGAKRWM